MVYLQWIEYYINCWLYQFKQ